MWTPAGQRTGPRPVARRFQRFRDPGAQVRQAGSAQAANRHPVPARCPAGQNKGGRNKHGIRPIGLGPRQNVIRRAISQPRVELVQSGHEIDDEAGFHRWRLAPGIVLRCPRWIARQSVDQGLGGGEEIHPTAGRKSTPQWVSRTTAAQRASRSPQAPRASPAFPAMMRSIRSAARGGGKRPTAWTRAVLSPRLYWPAAERSARKASMHAVSCNRFRRANTWASVL